MTSGGELRVLAPDGMPEVEAGADLAALVAATLRSPGTRAGDEPVDGDVVVVTSKVVSKAEGRVVDADAWESALAAESERVVASRGQTRIVRTRLGLVMAAAGIDRSNVRAGSIVLLPTDPDASARGLRERLADLLSVNVAVVVTDTAGRAWRQGQTDLAVGVAGMEPLESFVGRVDAHGHELAVTEPAVADEIAGAAELAQGKLGGRPVALVRGLGDLVLPVGAHGPGARALQRPASGDMFGLGTREAVLAALVGDAADAPVFGAPVSGGELAAALSRVVGAPVPNPPTGRDDRGLALPAGTPRAVVAAVCFSHGWHLDRWTVDGTRVVARVSPRVP